MTKGDRIEIATAGHPVEAVTAASLEMSDGEPLRITVSHDPGCPCTNGRPLVDCTCEIVGLVGRALT